jgi:hypothetical protein
MLAVEISLLGCHFLRHHEVVVVLNAVHLIADVVGPLLGCLLFCIIDGDGSLQFICGYLLCM